MSRSAERMHRLERDQPGEGVAVQCAGCGFAGVVDSRDLYAVIEELHVSACGVGGLRVAGEDPLDLILALPPG